MVVRGETVVAAAPDEVWGLVGDPRRLAEWWPGVTRVEDASPAAWTTVLSSPKGKTLRADQVLVEREAPVRIVWRQVVDGSPFERILAAAVTTLELSAAEGGTRVTAALDQKPRGWARFAPLQFRAAGLRQVRGALEGLGRHWERGG